MPFTIYSYENYSDTTWESEQHTDRVTDRPYLEIGIGAPS